MAVAQTQPRSGTSRRGPRWARARRAVCAGLRDWSASMAKKTLRDLLVEELRDLYHADKQLLKAFPRLAKGVTAEEMSKLCEEGVDYTEERIRRLEQAFELLGMPARG